MAVINSLIEDNYDVLKQTQILLRSEAWKSVPKAFGEVTMDTAGGVEAITISGVAAADIAICTIQSDDTGTAITSLVAVCSANTLTITRTDDGSSADDAVVNYVIFRG